jgi:hypothetical protein
MSSIRKRKYANGSSPRQPACTHACPQTRSHAERPSTTAVARCNQPCWPRRPHCQRQARLRLARTPKSTERENWGAVLSLLQLSARLRCGVVKSRRRAERRSESQHTEKFASQQRRRDRKRNFAQPWRALRRRFASKRSETIWFLRRLALRARHVAATNAPERPRCNGASSSARRRYRPPTATTLRAPWMALTLLRRKPVTRLAGARSASSCAKIQLGPGSLSCP